VSRELDRAKEKLREATSAFEDVSSQSKRAAEQAIHLANKAEACRLDAAAAREVALRLLVREELGEFPSLDDATLTILRFR
jgi:hypothetical protein